MSEDRGDLHSRLWDRQTVLLKDRPHGWLQWKGSSVCMDCYCACGHHFHIDDDFTYAVQCPECDRIYFVNGTVEFVEMDDRDSAEWIESGRSLKRDDEGEAERWAREGYPSPGPRRSV